MIPELGLIALIIAFLFACLLGSVPLYGLVRANQRLIDTEKYYLFGQVFFIGLAFLCLAVSFLRDDFSVYYVLSNSSVNLPWFYKVCAVWGGHEGSMLLWLVILSGWMLMVH